MSTLRALAERLTSGSDRLPVEMVVVAADRLSVAADLLAWVRGESPRPMGVPELSASVERLEHAASALAAARDCLKEYLLALGLSVEAEGYPRGTTVEAPRERRRPSPEPQRTDREKVPPLRRWWSRRVDELTGAGEADESSSASASRVKPPRRPTLTELLREVAVRVRSGDRDGLRAVLRDVDPPVGLSLSAITPSELRQLVHDVLGRGPAPDDLDKLRDATAGRVRELLPGLPPPVLETRLRRACHLPAEPERRQREERRSAEGTDRRSDEPASRGGEPSAGTEVHPTDSAVLGAVLVGVLAARLDRDPDRLGSGSAGLDPESARTDG